MLSSAHHHPSNPSYQGTGVKIQDVYVPIDSQVLSQNDSPWVIALGGEVTGIINLTEIPI